MVKPLDDLVEALTRLPSIGKKSAWRLALHLMERPADEVNALAQRLTAIKTNITVCTSCFNYSETDLCDVCSSSSRDRSIICVVEKPVDVFTIENSGRHRGLYHVLGGVLSPINGITADKLRMAQLVARVDSDHPRELIIGLGGSSDAETTCLYLARLLGGKGVRITRLARGLPAGMELEYVDQMTLSNALRERVDMGSGESVL